MCDDFEAALLQSINAISSVGFVACLAHDCIGLHQERLWEKQAENETMAQDGHPPVSKSRTTGECPSY